jgi:hypothetical protein
MFTIETPDGSQCLMWTGTDGSKAVLLFPTREAATTFLGTIKVATMHVVELTRENVQEWAAKVRRFGASEAIIDPQPDGTVTKRSVANLGAVVRTICGGHASN